MATRKKRVLTPEERLEAALVPEEEWPYKVPDNWCWVRVSHISQMQSGKNIKAKDISETQDSEHPYECFGGNGIRGYVATYNNSGRFPIVGRQGALCGNVNIADGDFYATEHAVVTTCNKGVDADWLYYALTEMNLNQYATATAQPGLAVGKIITLPIALPPAAEQHRIVNRIKWLFSKLDDAEAELREVIGSSEQRQAAILHKAFIGELSESWRTAHDVNQNTWSLKRFDEVAYIRSSLVDPATFAEYPHIAPDNIEKKTGTLLAYRTIAEDGVTSGKHHFYPGQILYSKIRPYLSKAVVVDFEGLCSADMYPIEAMEDTRYLWYFILSEDFLEQTYSAGSRTVLPKINQKGLSAIKVPIPTEAEQRFISEALDTYFEYSREAESQAMQAMHQIQSLKQSILAKALRGELGTNDPDEPSSKELLASIINANANKR